MPNLIEFSTENGLILVEVEGPVGRSDLVGKVGADEDAASPMVTKATQSFSSALDVVGHVAAAFVKQVDHMIARPSEVELKFGLKVIGEAGVFGIAKTGGEANFEVKLVWSGVERDPHSTPVKPVESA